MSQATIWWVFAGVLVAAELMTGTFYLLMVATGLAAAAIAAHLGVGLVAQWVVAAAVGGCSVIAWRRYRQIQPTAAPAGANRDVNLDIGETVQVDAWDADGNSKVKYRGASWNVSLLPGASGASGKHCIVEVIGSRLIVRKM
ncbi:MAG: NfeD family protein [Comamonadaceae bacterium]